jgi:hypothetical protein
MNHFLQQFDEPTAKDPVRVFPETWKDHPWLENVRSAYGMIVIGNPAKQVEWLSLGTHRIVCR